MKIEHRDCSACFKYDSCRQQDSLGNRSLRRCQRAIEEQYYTKIIDKDVLEIGCGTKEKGGFIKKIVEENNCRWTGIDIKETDLATEVCSVEKMPFEDNSFDYVLGSQTIEHWKKPKKALREIRRVLRPQGPISLTAPIHLHGEKMFVRGNFDAIWKLFEDCGLKVEKFETWRREHCDLIPYRPNDYAKRHLRKAGIKDFENITTYIIHCLLAENNDRIKSSFWQKIFGGRK